MKKCLILSHSVSRRHKEVINAGEWWRKGEWEASLWQSIRLRKSGGGVATIVRVLYDEGGRWSNRGREGRLIPASPPAKPDGRISRIRLSSQWAIFMD